MKEKLMSMLDVLAEKLGTTTELLWSVLVKQAEIEAQIWLTWLVAWVCVFGGMFLGSIILAYIGKKQKWEVWGLWFIMTTIIFIIGTVSILDCYSAFLTVSQNPEYWALNEILNTLK